MRLVGLLCGATFAAVLAGCGGNMTIMGGAITVPPNTTKCTLNDDCMVTVIVTPVGSLSCSIALDPATDLEMKSNGLSGQVSHLIRWVLSDDSQDAKFRFKDYPDGVALKSADTADQFFKQGPKSGGREYQWRDKNSNYAEYPYTINIVQKGSDRKCSLDPKIFNN
jgi:hypothetical protein